MSSLRKAGVLLHPTSLPGDGRTGTLGTHAHQFIDTVADCGLRLWQTLPLGPPDDFNSPYQCLSARAGNTALIDHATVIAWGWLEDTSEEPWLHAAHAGFKANATDDDREAYQQYCHEQASWLEDYALYVVIKNRHAGAPWWEWPTGYRDRDPDWLGRARDENAAAIAQCSFEQFVFERQWQAVRSHAHRRGIELFGDMPIFVAADSVEVWAQRAYFKLDDRGLAEVVTGVPPDAFSATGQRWGGVHYNWPVHQSDSFDWWRARVRSELSRFDRLRVDHFLAFVAAWEIPADEPTAMSGEWVDAPGEALLHALVSEFDALPLVAEDLGLITPAVEALRDTFSLPGMCVLQFAFGGGSDNPYLPHNHRCNSVVYTGTHDNDTTVGWCSTLSESERTHVCDYLATRPTEVPSALIRTALASVADTAVIPWQDWLGLDGSHRMNTPGVADGNWRWRFQWAQVPPDLASNVSRLVSLYGR